MVLPYSVERAKLYWRLKISSGLFGLAALIAFLAITQSSGISLLIKDFSLSLNGNFYMALLIYAAILGVACELVTFGFHLYSGYFIERRFMLSGQTLAGYLKDYAKREALSAIFFLALVECLYAIARNFGSGWWIFASGFWIFTSIILAGLFPVLVIPIFYKYETFKDEALRARILKLADRMRVKIIDIFEINLSRTTRKSNAAVVGWGRTRRVVLADNLVKEFSADEVEVVVAHEMAHHKLMHIWKHLLVEAVSISVLFYLLSRVGESLSAALGAAGAFDISILPAIILIFVLYGLAAAPVQNSISRKFEKDADMLALKTSGLREAFVSLMERLAEKNLADKTPNRLIEVLLYSHPSIGRRIEYAKKYRT